MCRAWKTTHYGPNVQPDQFQRLYATRGRYTIQVVTVGVWMIEATKLLKDTTQQKFIHLKHFTYLKKVCGQMFFVVSPCKDMLYGVYRYGIIIWTLEYFDTFNLGVKALAHGLSGNVACKKLDLKVTVEYICLTSVTRAKPKEKMEFPA